MRATLLHLEFLIIISSNIVAHTVSYNFTEQTRPKESIHGGLIVWNVGKIQFFHVLFWAKLHVMIVHKTFFHTQRSTNRISGFYFLKDSLQKKNRGENSIFFLFVGYQLGRKCFLRWIFFGGKTIFNDFSELVHFLYDVEVKPDSLSVLTILTHFGQIPN